MSLSTEDVLAAQEMHEFVRTYENQRRSNKLLIVPALIAMATSNLRLLMASQAGHIDHRVAWGIIGIEIALVPIALIYKRQAARRYRYSRLLLEALERDHGDELPYVQEAKILESAKMFDRKLVKHPLAS